MRILIKARKEEVTFFSFFFFFLKKTYAVRIGRTSRAPVCGISRLEKSTRRPRRHVARTKQNCYH